VIRKAFVVSCVATLACASPSGPATPSQPSLRATLHYPSGDSLVVTGSAGYWFIESATAARVVAFTASAPAGDAAHPSLLSIQFHFAGPAFASFPTTRDQPLGMQGGNGIGAQVGSQTGIYGVDSGTVALTPLGGGYARVAFTAWCGPAVAPYQFAFRVTGVVEVPRGSD
jgi:hypothetical protein